MPLTMFFVSFQTLDYLEGIVSHNDWTKIVPSLKDEFADERLGGWKSGREFLRMDGQDNGANRGEKIKFFNEDAVGTLKLFLISSRAGGIGINLCAASRVSWVRLSINQTFH